MIEFTSIVREEERAYVVTIPLDKVIDFLLSGRPSVVLVDGVPMEYKYAGDIFLEAQRYYIEHYPNETRAALQSRGLKPTF
jgi:hypothetical protein